LFLWDKYRLRKFIKKEQPDLVHAHGVEDVYALSISKVTMPKVLTLQSLYEDYNAKNPVKWNSPARIIEALEKRAMKAFDEVIVKSSQFAKVVKHYYPQVRYQIIPNTLNSVFLNESTGIIQSNKLAFVGTVCERKGFHIIRKALELIDSQQNQMELHVYGDGGDASYIEREIRKIKATGHILVHHGCVGAKILADELTTTNLLIAPSYAETFGNQVIEAMLCRCHCIVSDDTGMSDNVRKYGHGTVVPQKGSAEIAIAIERQLELVKKEASSKNEMRMRGRAREKIIEALGPEKIASQLVDLYQEKFKE